MKTPILKELFKSTEEFTTEGYTKLINFLGTLAEVESFKGEKQSNPRSSATGIFHFLVGNGGGYNKRGQKVSNGSYNASGNIATSSFQTAQTRLKNLMQNEKYSEKILDSGIYNNLKNIITATSPLDLSKQEQAVLVYANLKMHGADLDRFLAGEISDKQLYADKWVTMGKTHSRGEVDKNWDNAIIRTEKGNKDHFSFFELDINDADWTKNEYLEGNSDSNSDSEGNNGIDKEVVPSNTKKYDPIFSNRPVTDIKGSVIRKDGGVIDSNVEVNDVLGVLDIMKRIKNSNTVV